MSDHSAIQWTDATWNPVRGCSKVSTGCANCYAQTFAERWRGIPGHPYEQGFDVRLVEEALSLPLHWRKPRRVFVNSMSDLFHEAVPDSFIQAVFTTMAHYKGRHHTYQILTKRPARMQALLSSWVRDGLTLREGLTGLALPNVWLGVSVENQAAANERIPYLLDTPAAVRFLSCEPLLGPVDLDLPRCETHDREFVGVHAGEEFCNECAADGWTGELSYGHWLDPLNGGIQWVIVGGESGPRARPCDVAWIRSIVEQCAAAGTACFTKQLGANPIMEPGPLSWPCEDRSGADPAEWPEDLRVQQMPEVRHG